MFKIAEILDDCVEILEEEGLPIPDVSFTKTSEFYSFTDRRSRIAIGWGVRFVTMLGSDRLRHTVLHELLHILFTRYAPTEAVRRVFGDRAAWSAPQKMWNAWRLRADGCVSRYAHTHPEEDFVETAAFMLEGGSLSGKKARAVEQWFEEVRGAEYLKEGELQEVS